ncbi:FAS1 domain-containing protein [Dunaliella salina]|uniref:FAS1 domain-containing protein n=1 Tax=Dunaliella salina TaxID=3046 RepID=A0ABZ3KP70_DUNSA|nr:FAS1 domain-containing protein [Dunaliella salina]|eukprot:KAF5830968.1 FAS1 domain-containing protein [Dunaliella salina]
MDIIRTAIIPSIAIALCTTGKDYKEEDLSVDLATKWLKAAAEKAGEPEKTSGYTIFAPTDKAFKKLAKILKLDSVEGLVNGDEDVQKAAAKILGYHVVPDNKLYAEDALALPEEGLNVTTAIGEDLKIFTKDDKVLLKGKGKKSYAKVLKPDIEFEGNVVHVISSVLLPEGFDAYEAYYESLKSTKIAQKFWNATDAGEYVSGATVFAPIDRSFKKLAKALKLDNVTELLTNEKLVKVGTKLFKYLVIPDAKIFAADIPEGKTELTTAANKTLTVVKEDGKVAIASDDGKCKAYVLETDIEFSGNVVHVVSDLVVPGEWKEKWAEKKKEYEEDAEEAEESDDDK